MSKEQSEAEFAGPLAPDSRMSNWWFYGILTVVLLVFAAGVAIPVITGRPGKPFYNEIHTMAEVRDALIGFADEYGSFPNDETVAKILDEYPEATDLRDPVFAEDYLRQLVVAEYLDESVLKAMMAKGIRLTYVVWQEKMPTGGAPVLISPLMQGRQSFDCAYSRERMGSKGLQLSVDMSISTMRIDQKGNARVPGGADFFDADKLPWWNEQEWKLAWSEN